MDETHQSGTDIGGDIERRLGARLRAQRLQQGWSIEALAERSGVSRATLSRIENGEVSPTTGVLNRLCVAHGLPLSRLMLMVEGTAFTPLVRQADQPVWQDPTGVFTRRSVSPPAAALKAEVLACELQPGSTLRYDQPPRQGLEHHLVMLEGRLNLTVEGVRHELQPGDCLRFLLYGSDIFETPPDAPARYLLVLV